MNLKNKMPSADVGQERASRSAPDLSARIREICVSRGLTLRRLAAMTGLPVATLSKVQNNLATLNYLQLTKLAAGLNIDFSELFTASGVAVRTGRRTISRRGQAPKEATEHYEFEMLCAELMNKKMNTAIMEISARTLENAGGLSSHQGEEFIFVLSGTVIVHMEDYVPVSLAQGDSIYFDSLSGHAYVNGGPDTFARVLAITTHVFIDPRDSER
jgi:transcriptional regulator with XRE-family HTH domain